MEKQNPRKPMSRAKRIFVVLFLTVCAFGLYESFFPSKNPYDANVPVTPSQTTVDPSSTPTPTPTK